MKTNQTKMSAPAESPRSGVATTSAASATGRPGQGVTMELTLEALGISREDVIEKLIDRMADQLFNDHTCDEDGNPVDVPSSVLRKLEKMVQDRIDRAIEAVGDRIVTPKMNERVESILIQATNEWGEKRGKAFTLTEYMLDRANAYMDEEVNYNGITKAKSDYSWTKYSTRLVYMIDKHLQLQIETPIKQAMLAGNGAISKAIEGAVKIALEDIVKKLRVEVSHAR